MTMPSIRLCGAVAMMLFSAMPELCAADDSSANVTAPRSFSGTAPIVRAAPGAIELAPSVRVYPGETVVITASGTANVNQHNYQERRCKHFGLKCWYEERSDVNIQPAASFQIAIELADKDGKPVQMLNADDGTSGKSFVVTGDRPLRLTYELAPGLSRGLVLQVGIKSFNNVDFSRQSCNGRPQYCSSGGLKITLNNGSVEARRKRIDEQLAKSSAGQVDAVRIISRDYLDPLLLNGYENARAMRSVLVGHIVRWVEDADRDNGTKLVQLIRYSLQLSGDQNQTDTLNQALLDAYVAMGAYENVEDNARMTIADLNARCEQGCADVADAGKLAKALASLSKAQAEKRSRMDTSDLILSVGTLQRGISVLEETLSGKPFAENKEAVQTLSNLYQDAADRLSLIRTPDEIRHAVILMERSVCYQKIMLDGVGNSDGVFLPAECVAVLPETLGSRQQGAGSQVRFLNVGSRSGGFWKQFAKLANRP